MKRAQEAMAPQETQETQETGKSPKKGKWKADQHAEERGSPPPHAGVSTSLGEMAFRKSVEPEQPRQEVGPSSLSYDITTQAGRDELEASIQRDEVRASRDMIMQIAKNKLETLIQQERTGERSADWDLDHYTGTIGTLQEVQLIRKYHIGPEIQNLSLNEDFNLLSLRDLALSRQNWSHGQKRVDIDDRDNSTNFVQAWDILAETHPAKLRKILERAGRERILSLT
jgi:hypothetical protein